MNTTLEALRASCRRVDALSSGGEMRVDEDEGGGSEGARMGFQDRDKEEAKTACK